MYLKKTNILSVQSELKWIYFLQVPGSTLSSWYVISSLILTQTCEINITLYPYPWGLTYWYATNLPACSAVSTLNNYFNGLFSKSLSVSSDCHNKNAMKQVASKEEINFLVALKAETDMIDMLLGLFSGEGFLPELHTFTLSLSPQVTFVVHTQRMLVFLLFL